jgi:glycosyltransferase involved in cell wall biosynthesis
MSGRQRRLLVLCYFYPPLAGGGVHRVLGFTRHLWNHGWRSTVVCAGPEDYWVVDETLVGRVPKEVEVVRVEGGSALSRWLRVRGGHRGRRPSGTFAGLRRLADWALVPDPYVGWAARARAAGEAVLARGGIDAMLSTSPPDSVHVAARDLHRRHRLPWVADFRDPWMGLHLRTPPTAWHRRRQQALEKSVLEEADLVLAASRTHAEHAGERSGAKARRVMHLPNGYEAADGTAGSPAPDAGDPDHFRVVYTGTLSLMPEAEIVMEALHDLFARRPEARRRIRVTFAGPYDTGYEDRSIALGLKGIVEFPGVLTHSASRALQRGADLLLLWKPRGAPAMVPGKTYEYLDAGRPLLALLESGDQAADLVRRAGAEVVPPASRAEAAAAIERRYVEWRESGRRPDARPAWLDEHARDRLAARLAHELDALVEARA